MESFYLFIVIVLVVLAIVDLNVGVANDAANFLNSAFGSKVTARWVILVVASLGLLLGTFASTGMMEIARTGVFHPGMFTFHEVIMIFLAVMICDVIMLDMFNTFGLPTSTTVSLIFELLGAAVFVVLYKMWTSEPGTIIDLGDYINSARAMTLMSAILASVVLAFVCGSVVMFISRLLFSFRYKRSFKKFGALWCGLCLTAIAYFALFKGLKTNVTIANTMDWISDNIQLLLLGSFIGFSILMALLQHLFKVNILKIIVLTGTAALAMAFASNDLVNFIGVTMAGVSSYEIASAHAAAGGNVDTLLMSELAKPVIVNHIYLLIAGGIMAFTICFSKKAQSVTDTGVNLSRQDDGLERFGSSQVSRGLVRSARNLNKSITAIIPESVNNFIDRRFKPSKYELRNKASFDLIRASVNITVAALLISLATSLKLPLSTTYVTFMVAMGTSLSDRAWGRESAVYRITGVLTVISGWFLTAIIAFSAGAIVALLLMWGGKIAFIGLLMLAVYMLIQTSVIHKRREKKQHEHDEIVPIDVRKMSIVEQCKEDVYTVFEQISRIYTQTLQCLSSEDHKMLRKLYKEAKELYQKERDRKNYEMLPTLVKMKEDAVDTGHYYVQVLDYLNEVSKSLAFITKSSFEYIDNNHTGLSDQQVADLESINREVSIVYSDIAKMLGTSDFTDFELVIKKRDNLFNLFAEKIKAQIKRVKANESGTRNSMLYLNIVSETKTMLLQSRNLMRAQRLFIGYEEPTKK